MWNSLLNYLGLKAYANLNQIVRKLTVSNVQTRVSSLHQQDNLHHSNHFCQLWCCRTLLLAKKIAEIPRSAVSRIHPIIIKPLCNDSTYIFYVTHKKLSIAYCGRVKVSGESSGSFRERCRKFLRRKQENTNERKAELISKPCTCLCTPSRPERRNNKWAQFFLIISPKKERIVGS